MENGQKTIRELFNGTKIFNVPRYQRAYAWEVPQLQDFVDDIENQVTKRDYFFGTILLQEQGIHDDFEIIDIVDGQQRITTLVMFMKLLLKQSKDVGNNTALKEDTYIQYHDTYKLRIQEIDDDFFKSYILEDNKFDNSLVHTPSQRRLWKAREFLERWLETRAKNVKDFIDKIESMRVLTYSVEDDAEATLIFETTNDRGKSLTSLEKTKSFFMGKTYIASENYKDKLETLQSRFSEIYRNYEEIESRLEEDTILQYHFIAFEDWDHKSHYQAPVVKIKDKINRFIKEDKKAEAWNFIDRCSRELKESFETLKPLIVNPGPNLLDIFALKRASTFYPLLIKTYKLDNSDGKDNFKKVVQLSEIICFRFGVVKNRVDAGRERLYGYARTFKGDFDQLIKNLQNFIEYYCRDSTFRYCLESRFFGLDVTPDDQKYLFWKYENHLRAIEQPIFPDMSHEEFSGKDPQRKFSIEHIIPRNPADNEVVADKSICPLVDAGFLSECLHSIGNLTIDPVSANASKSNKDFEHKDQKYFSKAPLKTQNELSRFLNPETGKWDKTSISDRAEEIVEFALERWDYQNV